MKKKSRRAFPIIAVVCVVCFGAVGTVFAVDPYITITLPDVVDFGSIPNPSNQVYTPEFSMTVEASRSYDIVLTMPTTLLTHTDNTSTIDLNGFQVLTSLSFVQGTSVRVVQMQFSVDTTTGKVAGDYSGEIEITAIPGPPP